MELRPTPWHDRQAWTKRVADKLDDEDSTSSRQALMLVHFSHILILPYVLAFLGKDGWTT